MQHASNLYYFFNQLSTLLKSGISIVQSLTVLSQLSGKQKHTQIIALAVLSNIQKGYSFSRSVLLCPTMHVPNGIIHLLEAAECSACLNDVLDYICMQHTHRIKARTEIKDTITYPLIVVVTALVGTLFLLYWKELYLTSISRHEVIEVVIRAFLVFTSLLCVLSYYVYFSLKEPPLFQFYYTLGFLQTSGFTFSKSLELFLEIYYSAKEKEKIILAYNEIRRGTLAFESLRKSQLANEKEAVLLEIAEHSGTISHTCKTIAAEMMRVHEFKKNRCIRLIEPFLLFIVGVYLLILMEGVLIPYITDFGGVI